MYQLHSFSSLNKMTIMCSDWKWWGKKCMWPISKHYSRI